MFKFNSEEIKNHLSSLIFLAILIAIISIITYKCFQIQTSIGPVWDTYDLLSEAAFLAGQNIGYYDLIRPPLIPFLTSILFRIVGLSTWPIMLIDGLIFILGSAGLFLFLKVRFDNLTSFLGALLFSTFPLVLTFVCSGLTDTATVCISIWALLFTVLAVKRDSRWFYLSFPILMLAFLTRFTSALIIFPMFFFILINLEEIKHRKDILIGIVISFLFLIPVFWLFYVNFGNPLYTFLNFFSSSSGSVSQTTEMLFSYNPDFFYFAKAMPSLMGPQAMGVVLVIFLGLLICPFQRFMNKRKSLENQNELNRSLQLSLRKDIKIKSLFLSILIIIFILTLQRVHYLFSEIILFPILYLIYSLVNEFKFKNIDLDFLFLSWFMVFFIFHSVYVIKDYRYFIDMTPSLAYFLMRGFTLTTSQLGIKIKNRNVTHYLFSGFLIFLIIFSTYNYLPSIGETNKHLMELNEGNTNISVWLMNYDPNYKNKVIYSDIWPYSGWSLQRNVSKMPQFVNHQAIYTGAKEYNLTTQDIMDYNNELDSNQADYYISRRIDLTFINYRSIKHFNGITLYQRID